MFQYVSITSTNGEKIAFANTFIDYLLSEEVQKKLVDISMFSVNGYKLYNDNEHFSQFENENVKYTISPFLQTQTLDNVKMQSKESFISKKNTPSVIFLRKCHLPFHRGGFKVTFTSKSSRLGAKYLILL
jgi:hypothetical protein